MEVTLGGVVVKPASQSIERFSALFWGRSGSGKTTLAATAPGEKLWINFDPDGIGAIAHRPGIHVLDFSAEPAKCVELFKSEDPLKLSAYLRENPQIETVVFDSLTTFRDKALEHGVVIARTTTKGAKSTLEDPGYSGYGNLNVWTRLCVNHMLKVTQIAKRHMIFIAHEDKPERDDKGVVMYISIMLGSSLVEQVPIQLGEIWALEDTGTKRRIAVRPCRWRKPMKTKMFVTNKDPEFDWDFDAITWKGETVEDWFNKWRANEFKKIELPKSKTKEK